MISSAPISPSPPPVRRLVVAIDGPAGAGKSTTARLLAERLGYALLDTGAIYRTLALTAREHGISWDDGDGVAALAAVLDIRFQFQEGVNRVSLAERDVTAVRIELLSTELDQQRQLAAIERLVGGDL